MWLIDISKTTRIITALFVIFALSSCKTCINCDCYKNGVKTQEEDCLYTNNKMNSARNFGNSLMREKGYDDCACTY